MAKDKDIESGARAIAEDFKLPGGRRKAVAKLVRQHLSWFDATKDRGMAVDDILRLLTRAGATYEDGSSINFDTLSNALWRVRADSAPNPTSKSPRLARSNKPAVGGHAPEGSRTRTQRTVYDNRKPKSQVARNEAPTERPNARPRPEQRKTSSVEVLGFMRRAAAIRRPSND